MDKMDKTSQDVNNLYNVTTSLATSLSYHQIVLYIRSVLANLWDSLSYIKTVSTHTHGLHRWSYNRNTFSAHFTNNGPKEDVIPHRRNSTIYTASPSFIWGHPAFLLLSSYTCFHHQQAIPTPHQCTNSGSVTTTLHLQNFHIWYYTWYFPACYDINTKYLGIKQDETIAVEISPQQFRICQEANGQFCAIPTPFQPLANPPSCITASYAKNTASISARCTLQIRKSSDVSMPSQLAPNVWILTMLPSAAAATITIMCPGETTQFVEIRKPIHILCLPTACRATITQFPFTPTLWRTTLRSKYIFGYGKPKHDKYIIYKFPHMATLGEALEWESATAFGQYTPQLQ